ncbi:methylmalonyl-CoA mutase family protein [Brevibacillus fluminis]|uniref:methylmalonyl-CoA mutase family protein n=1 Tax=Brevibacillus fluminis TaxID=511487 RepID=UPI003F8C52BB
MMFRDFSKPTYEEWKARAEKLLNGASFEQKLVTQTYEGIAIQPLYRGEDTQSLPHMESVPGAAPYVRGTDELGYASKPWAIAQEVGAASPEAFNQAVRYDLERGQTMVNVPLDRASSAGVDADQAEADQLGQGGVSLSTLADVEQLLAGIDLGQTPIMVQAGNAGLAVLAMVAAHLQKSGQGTAQLRGVVGADPLGELARAGALSGTLAEAYDAMADATRWAIAHAPALQTVLVQANPYHDGGASAVEELAFALATGVAYLRELDARGIEIDDAAPRMRFSFSLGSHFFTEIAKLRAARMLWAKIVEAFGGNEQAQKLSIHARTSARTKTVHDPYVNMLRGTTEAFAGVVGGADSLHVSPFDEAIRPADEFSRRIARNTQLILQNEAHLTKVADPAGGSWYIEALTDELAQKAWALFQEVEAAGGMALALQAGLPQEKVAAIAAKRAANMSKRKDKMVGTNVYPNLHEAAVPVLTDEELAAIREERRSAVQKQRAAADRSVLAAKLASYRSAVASRNAENVMEAAIDAVSHGATLGEIVRGGAVPSHTGTTVQPIPLRRDAAAFEALRANAERYKQKHGSYPQAYIAKLGTVSQYKARADFSTGFVEAGGFQGIQGPGFTEVEAAAEAALASDASLVVICSHDELYPELAPAFASLIKAKNPQLTVWLAGRPAPEQAAVYKAAGVDDFIYMGADCAGLLARLSRQKGIGL